MDMSAGNKELLGDATALGTGVLAWMYTSTKTMDGPGTPIKQRFEDALANTLGRGVVLAIDPKYSGTGDLTPKITGFINKTTFAGAGLLVADYIAMNFPQYKNKLDGLHNIVEGAGWGITLGGIFGGIFDPDVTQVQSQQGNPNTQGNPLGQQYAGTPGNLPFPRAGQLGVGPQVV